MQINFWQICDTEGGWDYCILETSTNNGSSWAELARWDGSSNAWEEITLNAPDLDTVAQAKIRFRFTSDLNTVQDGWHVDDIRIIGTGVGCVQTTATINIYLPIITQP